MSNKKMLRKIVGCICSITVPVCTIMDLPIQVREKSKAYAEESNIVDCENEAILLNLLNNTTMSFEQVFATETGRTREVLATVATEMLTTTATTTTKLTTTTTTTTTTSITTTSITTTTITTTTATETTTAETTTTEVPEIQSTEVEEDSDFEDVPEVESESNDEACDEAVETEFVWNGKVLTSSMGIVVADETPSGLTESWYNLPMYGCMDLMGLSYDGYKIRDDGVKTYNGYVMVASPDLNRWPKGSYIQTTNGMGYVVDYCEGGRLDIAVDWVI